MNCYVTMVGQTIVAYLRVRRAGWVTGAINARTALVVFDCDARNVLSRNIKIIPCIVWRYVFIFHLQ